MTFIKYLKVFLVAMIPVVELRGAIPFGVTKEGLPLFGTIVAAVIGNMVPVPFIILFIRPIFEWMKKKSRFYRKIVEKMELRAEKKAEKIQKYALFGLFLLVAIPLPGTGAWTGALVAALFDIRLKHAVPVIFFGVIVAAAAVSLITYGAKAFFGI